MLDLIRIEIASQSLENWKLLSAVGNCKMALLAERMNGTTDTSFVDNAIFALHIVRSEARCVILNLDYKRGFDIVYVVDIVYVCGLDIFRCTS